MLSDKVRKLSYNPDDMKYLPFDELRGLWNELNSINDRVNKINNTALRKELVQNIIIHELLHVTNEDLFTLSKNYNKRKKKKIHVNDFENEVFNRYNKLRDFKKIRQIKKREYLDIAIQRILEKINWFDI